MNGYNNSMLNPLPGEKPCAEELTITPILPPASPPVQPAQPSADQAFCQFCGSRVATDAVLCVSCGRQIKALHSDAPPPAPEVKTVSSGVFALAVIVTILFPVAGLFFGISGLIRRGHQGHGAALIVLALVMFFLYWQGMALWHH